MLHLPEQSEGTPLLTKEGAGEVSVNVYPLNPHLVRGEAKHSRIRLSHDCNSPATVTYPRLRPTCDCNPPASVTNLRPSTARPHFALSRVALMPCPTGPEQVLF